MAFNPISSASTLNFNYDPTAYAGAAKKPTMGQQVENFLSQVNDLQTKADQASNKLALGDVRSMHAVMIASEEASMALSTVLQVRNKALESYQEIMRMQV